MHACVYRVRVVYACVQHRNFQQREQLALSLDKYVSGSATTPLLVHGEPGSGARCVCALWLLLLLLLLLRLLVCKLNCTRSALLANWAARHRVSHPEDVATVVHFCGASPNSTNYRSIVARICAEVVRDGR